MVREVVLAKKIKTKIGCACEHQKGAVTREEVECAQRNIRVCSQGRKNEVYMYREEIEKTNHKI